LLDLHPSIPDFGANVTAELLISNSNSLLLGHRETIDFLLLF
jgi:hypothetical protein